MLSLILHNRAKTCNKKPSTLVRITCDKKHPGWREYRLRAEIATEAMEKFNIEKASLFLGGYWKEF